MGVMANKTLWLPPKVSKGVYKTYVATIKKIYKDKKFKKKTKKSFGRYPQAIGKRARQVLKGAVQFTPAARKVINELIDKKMKASM